MLELIQCIMFMFIFWKFNFLMMNLMMLLSLLMLLNLNWVDWSFLVLEFGTNFFNFAILILMIWIFSLVFLSFNKSNISKMLINLMLMIVMYLNFISFNLLSFYFFFEFSLLLIFYIIMIYGYSSNRYLAGYYIMFYTMVFSLPFLFLMYYLCNFSGTLNFYLLENINFFINLFMMFYMIMSFLVKIPMYLFHSWLLKAHVEAPYYGSMILAAIVLKLGGYGLIRMLLIFKSEMFIMKEYIIYLSLLGMLILSVMCLRQIDMKVLVAMSSIVHMGILIMGILIFTKIGVYGGYLMMIAHGLSSSGLFYLINIVYKLTHSRLFMFNKGLLLMMPSFGLVWFLLCSSNMSAPMSLNLVSEIFLLISIISWMYVFMLPMIIYCVLSFIYSLYLYVNLHHGNNKNLLFGAGNMKDFIILMLHWLPLNLIILNLTMII